MKLGSRRIQALIAVLTLAAGGLAIDMLGRSGAPKSAAARSLAEGGDTDVSAWERLARLADVLAQRSQPSALGAAGDSQRDLFVSTPLFAAAFAQAAQAAEDVPHAEPTEVRDEAAADEPEAFASRYRLDGVLLGRTRLAIVNGQVLRLNSDLEGHRLIEIDRGHVVFEETATGRRVRLDLDGGPKNP